MKKSALLMLTFWGSLAAGQLSGQTLSGDSPAPPPAAGKPAVFEVASIKASDPGKRADCFMKGQPGGQTFIGRCVPLRVLIKYAYKIADSQISNGPAWMDTEAYDFEAKTDRPVTRAEIATLFQKLLAERFKLQFHLETRTLPSMVLSMDKGGQKMTPSESTYEWEIPITTMPGSIPKYKGTRCPMSYLAWWIGQQQNRPVIDKTELAGFWDFTLEYVPDGLAEKRIAVGNPLPVDGPNLATALREQLGLKLESGKGPVDVYVIDHVEKATAN